jgi:hypothetical protein
MHTRALLPLLAVLPLAGHATEARAHELVVGGEQVSLDPAVVHGGWSVRSDRLGCARGITFGVDNTITFVDGGGAGTWLVHGDSVQVNVTHQKMPVAEAGIAAKKHVKVRWTGSVRQGAHGKLVAELVVEVLDDAGAVKQTRHEKFTLTRS